ncbi:MAG: HIT family protein [Candidatus Woesearchaeota archaeon]
MKLSPEQQKALEAQKEQCPFCKIIKGEIPSKKVFEDDKVIAILDINPANKGHLLVMPKEHYPIMPLIPPETFEYLSIKVKQLSKAVKESMLVFGTNIFIANGAAAGQQSQHFMLHIIPREENDGISMFDFEKIEIDAAKEAEAYKILSNNLPRMLKEVYKRFPLQRETAGALGNRSRTAGSSGFNAGAKIGYNKEELLKIIDMNPQLKQAIMKNPMQFRQMIPQNPQLKQLFENIDVNEIIETVSGKKMADAIDSEFDAPQADSSFEHDIRHDDKFKQIQDIIDINKQTRTADERSYPEDEENEAANDNDKQNDEDYDIFDVIDGNPKLKLLLIESPDVLKNKIEELSALKETFGDIDIDDLREQVIQRDKRRKNRQENVDEDNEKKEKSDDIEGLLG